MKSNKGVSYRALDSAEPVPRRTSRMKVAAVVLASLGLAGIVAGFAYSPEVATKCWKGFRGQRTANLPSEVDEMTDCRLLFDGCNECSRSEPGGALACTKMACEEYTTPVCHEYFADGQGSSNENLGEKPSHMMMEMNGKPKEECFLWFDGCNRCRRSSLNSDFACTRKFCPPGMRKPTKCLDDEN